MNSTCCKEVKIGRRCCSLMLKWFSFPFLIRFPIHTQHTNDDDDWRKSMWQKVRRSSRQGANKMNLGRAQVWKRGWCLCSENAILSCRLLLLNRWRVRRRQSWRNRQRRICWFLVFEQAAQYFETQSVFRTWAWLKFIWLDPWRYDIRTFMQHKIQWNVLDPSPRGF